MRIESKILRFKRKESQLYRLGLCKKSFQRGFEKTQVHGVKKIVKSNIESV